MRRTYVIAWRLGAGTQWCRDNGVSPYSRQTVIATSERALRGHTIRDSDRVVWVDDGASEWRAQMEAAVEICRMGAA